VLLAGAGLVLAGCGGNRANKTGVTTGPEGTTRAETHAEASNADKLVGVWEVVKSEEAPPGATIEFTKDGKLKMAVNVKGKEMTQEGTYKVEGDKITSVQTFGGKEHRETAIIQTLNDTTLVTRDEKGKVDEFKRKR
jgi:uncharacterized protein (TIGR03066 family)